MSSYYSDECPNFSKEQLSNQKRLIKATADWIIERVTENLESGKYSEQLKAFRNDLIEFMEERFSNLHCANLRTTRADTPFIRLATQNGIPAEALPQNTSIVVTGSMAYYSTPPVYKRVILALQ